MHGGELEESVRVVGDHHLCGSGHELTTQLVEMFGDQFLVVLRLLCDSVRSFARCPAARASAGCRR